MDEITKKKNRLTKLRVLTESPHGVDLDFVKNYAAKKASRFRNQMKIKHEVHESKRHLLVEELALTSAFLEKCKGVLDSREVDILEMYEHIPNDEILHFMKVEWKENWTLEELRKEVIRIKRKVGAHREKLKPKPPPKVYEKPVLFTMELVEEVLQKAKDKLFGKKK